MDVPDDPVSVHVPRVRDGGTSAWREDGETWRPLKVTFPDSVVSRTREQVSYFGEDGLLRRHQYTVDVLDGARGVNYASDYREVDGIMVPTKRRVYAYDDRKNKIPRLCSSRSTSVISPLRNDEAWWTIKEHAATDAEEVLVERAKPLRNNAGPDEAAFVIQFNDLMANPKGPFLGRQGKLHAEKPESAIPDKNSSIAVLLSRLFLEMSPSAKTSQGLLLDVLDTLRLSISI